MEIVDLTATIGVSAFFADDQAAITAGAEPDGFTYDGEPRTPGFDRIREPGEALIVELGMSDGRFARGDCVGVQYAAAGDRDPVFRAADHAGIVEGRVADALIGRDPAAFVENIAVLEEMEGVHSAVEYGVSGALLAAAATARCETRTRVLADALDTEPATEPVPVFGQSGDDRRCGAEKMLLKRVDVLPHGLFNSLKKVGPEGKRLVEYLAWLSKRTDELGPAEYNPRFHIDVYGMLADVFGPPYDRDAVVEYVDELRRAAAPYPLQIEEPMIAANRADQIAAMGSLNDGLADADVAVDLVADEWCEDREDVMAFVDADAADMVQIKTPDVGSLLESGRAIRYSEGTSTRAYLGGTCNETVTSARASAHLALATDAAQVLAKPGMGFDEGYSVVANEMYRTLARHRRSDR